MSNISQDSYSNILPLFNPPGLTDHGNTCLDHLLVSPDLCAVPINPQILHSPHLFVYQLAQGNEEPDTSDSENYRGDHCISDSIEANNLYQQPLANPT